MKYVKRLLLLQVRNSQGGNHNQNKIKEADFADSLLNRCLYSLIFTKQNPGGAFIDQHTKHWILKRSVFHVSDFKETGVRLLPFYPNKTLNQQKTYSVMVPSSLISNSFAVLSAPIILTI